MSALKNQNGKGPSLHDVLSKAINSAKEKLTAEHQAAAKVAVIFGKLNEITDGAMEHGMEKHIDDCNKLGAIATDKFNEAIAQTQFSDDGKVCGTVPITVICNMLLSAIAEVENDPLKQALLRDTKRAAQLVKEADEIVEAAVITAMPTGEAGSPKYH